MILKEEKGSFTVEAAIIVPIILIVIVLFMLFTVKQFNTAMNRAEIINSKYTSNVRNPVSIINNTDLIIEYIDKLKSYLKGESK